MPSRTKKVHGVRVATTHGRALVLVKHDLEHTLRGLGQLIARSDASGKHLHELGVVSLLDLVDSRHARDFTRGRVHQILTAARLHQSALGLELLRLHQRIDCRAVLEL